MPQPSYRARVLLPIGLTAISFASILIKVCEAPPLVIAAYRLTLATIVLLFFSLPRTLRELRSLDRREILLSALAGVFLCFHFAFWVVLLYKPNDFFKHEPRKASKYFCFRKAQSGRRV